MNKILLLMILPFVFLSAVSAQITQKEADGIVLERLSQETPPFTLFAKEGVQTGVIITTSTGEELELDYPCRIYYFRKTGTALSRYLIVKESNGNLLEVNAKNDAGPKDLAGWKIKGMTPVLIAQGALYGNGSEGITKQNLVLTNKAAWDNLVAAMNSVNHVSNNFTETNIDFSKYQVIAVFDEVKGSGGWSIDITDITEKTDEIVVTVKNVKKGNDATVMTQPYHIIKIPVSEKKIVFQVVNPVITKTLFSGYVQKGPYTNGSSVMITLLDTDLNQTGTVFSTQIVDNSGNFEQRNIKFASDFIELKADGYYFNEIKGETSGGSLTLYALADISDANSVNVNVLTSLERQRIIYLIQNSGLSFSQAKKQARREVLDIFKFALPGDVAAEFLNIADDVLLLAVSAIAQGHLSTGDLSELLANISADIRKDGKLDNPRLGSQLMNNAVYIDCDQIISNMKKKYSGLGIAMNVTANELKKYVDQFMQNCGFQQTLSITYPATGKYGPNILADGVVMVKKTGWGVFPYSIKAILPEGKSGLKIVIRSESAYGGYSYNSGSEENWLISPWDNNLKGHTWTVYENGKPADAAVFFTSDCIVEYYENGATTPTKVKKLYIGGDAAEDDQHERDMLIAFYQATNGDKWIKKDNWCSDKPVSLWYGIETWYDTVSKKNHVLSITLPNNNLTGSACLTDLKSLYDLNILNGNNLESLTINNCGNELPDSILNNCNPVLYHDHDYTPCNLKTVDISKSNGYIHVDGNFSAEKVTVSNCKLSARESMYFNSASTKIGTLTVSNCTMGNFYADSSVIGNITIENCSFLSYKDLGMPDSKPHIYIGNNKAYINNCTGLHYIYSALCSNLIVTNTICDDIRCGNE